jgi:hypothetical protein
MTLTTKCSRCGKAMHFTMPATDDPHLDQTLAKFASMAWCDACTLLTQRRPKPQTRQQQQPRMPYKD